MLPEKQSVDELTDLLTKHFSNYWGGFMATKGTIIAAQCDCLRNVGVDENIIDKFREESNEIFTFVNMIRIKHSKMAGVENE